MKSIHFFKSVEDCIRPDFISESARILNESEQDISKITKISIATILTGFLSLANSPAAIEEIMLKVFHKNYEPFNLLKHPEKTLKHPLKNDKFETASSIQTLIFGPHENAVLHLLSKETGIKSEAFNQFILILILIVVSICYKLDLNSSRLIAALHADNRNIAKLTPKGITSLLISAPTEIITDKTDTNEETEEKFKPKHKWIIPLLIAIIGLLLFYIFYKPK
ncbi:DUF937 domain-containing protein [Formosa sp. S-31]|uniref:DUF937 domain-containing protein n=1 Tax=Formosa sp. S-31 TaxID=2790949 RepID=UPI003EC04D87